MAIGRPHCCLAVQSGNLLLSALLFLPAPRSCPLNSSVLPKHPAFLRPPSPHNSFWHTSPSQPCPPHTAVSWAPSTSSPFLPNRRVAICSDRSPVCCRFMLHIVIHTVTCTVSLYCHSILSSHASNLYPVLYRHSMLSLHTVDLLPTSVTPYSDPHCLCRYIE